MMLRLLLIFALILTINFHTTGQTCSGCEILVPNNLPADTVYLSDALSGQVGVVYDHDLSFRLPQTTTPVADENTPAGLPISQFEITGVANLPPGLEWTPNQTTYDPAEMNDGCAKLCGTPLVAGEYIMQVSLVATVFVINAETILDVPITIAPSQSMTDGFTLRNGIGCGETLVSFRNNIPSNGREGYSYQWDFGNGQMTDREDPLDVEYVGAGKYIVDYQAVIDTTGHFLTNVFINNVECDDLIGGPDLQIRIFDEVGTEVFTSAVIENAETPLNIETNFMIAAEAYTLSIFDVDRGLAGADDLCGEFQLNQLATGIYTEETNDISLSYNILHPTDTIRSQDTVIVHAIPDTPQIEIDGMLSFCDGDSITLTASYAENIQWHADTTILVNETSSALTVKTTGQYFVTYTSPEGCSINSDTISINVNEIPETPTIDALGEIVFCEGDSTILVGSYPENIQWFFNDSLIMGAIDSSLVVRTAGNYAVKYTSPAGCSVISNAFRIVVNDFPDALDFSIENNTLTAIDTSALGEETMIQWYLDGNVIEGAVNGTFCMAITGNYGLEITNAEGCAVITEQEAIYNEDFPNCVSDVVDIEALATGFKLYPNPTSDILNVQFFVSQSVDIELIMINSLGQIIRKTPLEHTYGEYQKSLSVANLPTGIYSLKIRIGDAESSVKFVKK